MVILVVYNEIRNDDDDVGGGWGLFMQTWQLDNPDPSKSANNSEYET